MANTIVVDGNLVADIDLRFSKSGGAVARGRIAVNRRKKVGDDWEDETSFFDFSILDDTMSHNAADSLTKGARVVLTGRLEQRSWETDEGEKRSAVGIIVEDIGPSLRWATATVIKNPKQDGGNTVRKEPSDFFDGEPF